MSSTQARSISGTQFLHRALPLLLCLQPLFVLTVKSWSSGALLLGGLASMFAVSLHRRDSFSCSTDRIWQHHAFILSFSLLFICIGITGLFRQDLHVAQLDSPARFLLAIPIFVLIRRSTTDVLTAFTITVAAGTLLTLGIQLLPKTTQPWDPHRMSSHFADPLSFGYISLSFALLALVSLWHTKRNAHGRVLSVLTGLALVAGLYMSIQTASRTGWLAIPVLASIAIYFHRKSFTFGKFAISVVVFMAFLLVLYHGLEKVQARVDATVSDLSNYSFEGIAPDTSVGLRITFLRIAADMISERPILGFGDTQANKPEVPGSVKTYATKFAIDFALGAGFHNEVVTTAVQYGVFSALAAVLCFLIPLSIYWIGLASSSPQTRHAASLGIVFTIVYMVSSISTEVFGLKYTVSLYAMTTAILCGIVTRDHNHHKRPHP